MNSQQEVDWPNWQGETVVIVATGPSVLDTPLNEAQGKARFITINNSWRVAPWADMLYGCDRNWWVEQRGVPKFKGMKVGASPSVSKVYPDVRLVDLVAKAEILTGQIGKIGCGLRSGGGHSGFQAINLAVQLGVKRIVLVGFDMRLDRGAHWHEDRMPKRPNHAGIEECRVGLDGCSARFVELGVQVLNASPVSALQNYQKVGLLEAVK